MGGSLNISFEDLAVEQKKKGDIRRLILEILINAGKEIMKVL